MTLSAVCNHPKFSPHFSDKPLPDPTMHWEKLKVQFKLELLAKENVPLDRILPAPPDAVIYSQNTEETILESSTQLDSKTGLKCPRKNEMEKHLTRNIDEGILRAAKPRAQVDKLTADGLATCEGGHF